MTQRVNMRSSRKLCLPGGEYPEPCLVLGLHHPGYRPESLGPNWRPRNPDRLQNAKIRIITLMKPPCSVLMVSRSWFLPPPRGQRGGSHTCRAPSERAKASSRGVVLMVMVGAATVAAVA